MQPAIVPSNSTRAFQSPDSLRGSLPLRDEVCITQTDKVIKAATQPSHHIVHIIKHCGYANGNVHVAVDLACVQARSGHKVTFISAGGTFVPLLEQWGVHHVTLNHDQGKPLSMLRTMWKVIRFTRLNKPYVINAHMMSSALVAWVASKASGVPLVTTVHNSFDKHSSIMRLGRLVVAVSHAERESLLKKRYPSDRLVAIMNAPAKSPRDAFMDDGQRIILQAPAIVAVNALHRRKGVFDLIEACTHLFAELPAWKLYIAGEGPDREQLERQAAAAGIADRIVFLGFVAAPNHLLQQADIFVLASYADPCSLVIGEARAAGCAIVATDVGGTREMLEFGRAGRLVPPGRPDTLAAVLKSLMIDDHERHELQRASRRGASIFHVERLGDDYARVYMQAQEGRPV